MDREKLNAYREALEPDPTEMRVFDAACGHLMGKFLYTREEAEDAMRACYLTALKRRSAPKKRRREQAEAHA
jgi:hypothetical protein